MLDLLNANYTFVNERLARHYGIPNVYGSQFRRVTLTDRRTGKGLLGQGSILTVTSYADADRADDPRQVAAREHPRHAAAAAAAERSVARRLKDDDGKPLTDARSRWKQHRANPVCAVCHKVMDPLGFALENFDAIGKWRTDGRRQPDRHVGRHAGRLPAERARRICATI